MIEAFIPAAGLGTRLKPLTDHRPKALVEVEGQSLLEIAIHKMKVLQASRIVVNVHHFADMMIDYIKQHDWGVEVLISDERNQLLDTGGGIKHAEPLFSGNNSILIHNVDVLDTIDYTSFIDHHNRSNALATLAVSERSTSRYLLANSDEELKGWMNTKTGDVLPKDIDTARYRHMAFSGIALIEPSIFQLLPQADTPYPIVPEYLRIAEHEVVNCFEHNADDWLDVGKPESIILAAQMLHRNNE